MLKRLGGHVSMGNPGRACGDSQKVWKIRVCHILTDVHFLFIQIHDPAFNRIKIFVFFLEFFLPELFSFLGIDD